MKIEVEPQLFRMVESVRLIATSSVFVAEVIHHLKMKNQPSLYDIDLLRKANKELARLNHETTLLSEALVEITECGEEE